MFAWKKSTLWAVIVFCLLIPLSAWASPALGRSEADIPPSALRLPHDVDRLPDGHTLITDGGFRLRQGEGVTGRRGDEETRGQGDSQIIEVDADGNIVWSFGQGLDFAHNADRLSNGHTLISDTGHDRVIEIDAAGNVVWNSDDITLSDGTVLRYPNDANWLSSDHLLITDRDNHRVIEIDRDGTIVWQFGETGVPGDDASHLNGPHNADRLSNGNTIIADSLNNRIIEVAPDGTIVWEYKPTGPQALDWPRDADRLPNGNTLITDSRHDRIIEVTSTGQVVWQYDGLDLPYDADRLPNGNTLIADSRNSRVIEVDATGAIVWQYPPAPTGTIAGTVRDTGGQPISGVNVTVFGTALSDTTDADGQYTIPDVPAAAPRYIVTASKPGYLDAQAGNIDVSEGTTTTVDFTLEAGVQVTETLHVLIGRLMYRDPSSEKLIPPPTAVLSPTLYPAEVLPYLQPGQYIESDDPAIVAVAQSILADLTPEQRTEQTTVAHAVYVWMVQNIEYDLMRNYPDDVTSGNWQTTYGAWGHSFAEWLYTAKEVLEERRAICIEHARLATALLRAVGIPARPAPLMAHPVTQWWVQLPDGSGFWANMDTSIGRSAYVRTGDLWANFPSVEEHRLGFWAVDADAPIHMDWWTDNPCIWREDYGGSRRYPATADGLAQAQAALAHFAETGELPSPGSPLAENQPYYELSIRGFVVDLTNAREQTRFEVGFPLAIETDYLERIDQVHWTNHPEWVTRTWLETESDPTTGESLTWYRLELDVNAGDECELQNLLSNPGFETGQTSPDDWTTFPPSPPDVAYEWDDSVFASGARSVSVESTGSGFGMWRQVVSVSPGTVYRFSGFVKVESVEPPGRCNLQVVFRDADGEILGQVDLSPHSGTIPWIYDFPHEVNVRAPANAATAEVNLYLQGQGKAWFDDIFFGPAPTGSISGTVTSAGEPLAGARVIIWGTDYEAVTDEQGRYVLSNIPDASPRYILIASKEGYKDKPQGDVDVVACQTTTVDFDLEPGPNLEDPELRVKFGSLALAQHVPPPQIPPDAVIDPDIYPDSVLPYLQPSEYIDSDHPSVVAVAQEILASLPPEERTNAREVSYAVYRWIIENIEFDVIYVNDTFTDVTSGSWQTISGEGWSWGHNFNDWLYKPSEMLAEKRGICIEHSRLATALLRAVGIPARPVSPYSAQFWVQSPSGEGTWVVMSTSSGRAAYRSRGDTQAEYGTLSPGAVRYFPVDEGPVIHSDWYTENKCMWHEVHPWGERYEGTPAGYEQAVADLEEFARTGKAPKGQHVPPDSELYYEIAYSDFTLHLSNIGDQRVLRARFPIIMASSYVTPTGDVAYWTNHPEWVTRTWIEDETNPPVEGVERWFYIEFDLSELQPRPTYLPLTLKSFTLPLVTPTPTATPSPTPTVTPSPTPTAAYEPPINVTFNIHLDPVLDDYQKWRERKDNLLWLKSFVEGYSGIYQPKLNIQVQGDHAEFYLDTTDPEAAEGRAALAALYAAGHSFGTHAHNTIRGEAPHSWTIVRGVPTPAEVVENWQDHIGYVEQLYAQITGSDDPEFLCQINASAAMFLPGRYDEGQLAFSGVYTDPVSGQGVPHGFSAQTGGRNERFICYFDHDVQNPWRPGPAGPLDEDLTNTAFVTIPQMPSLGRLGAHAVGGCYQDNSLPSQQRRFLQEFLERLYREYTGQPDKVWTFGWHEHLFDLYPTGASGSRGYQCREAVQQMVDWLNERFIGRTTANGNLVARYATVTQVRDEFLAWEAEHPGVSSFEYNLTVPDWEAYPYELKGLTRELANAHYEAALLPPDSTLQVYRFDRCPSSLRGETQGYWIEEADGAFGCYDGPDGGTPLTTTTLYVAWRDAATAEPVDLTAYVGPSARVYDAVTGDELEADLSALPLSYRAKIIIPTTTTAGYFLIAYNANYLWGPPVNVHQATADQFVGTLNRHLDLMDRLGLSADYYFTGLAAEKLADWSLQTVTRLLTSTHSLNYHGANRPPYPSLVNLVQGESWEEDVALVRAYEEEGRHPTSGEHVGGIAAFRTVFGQDPFSTGRFFEASILAVDKELGVRMGVGLQGNTGASRNDAWFLGILNRPESLALAPAPLVDAALHDRGDEYLAQVRAQLTGLTDPMPVVAFLVHDHDFFKHPPADREKIWDLYEQVLLLARDLGFQFVTMRDLYALVQNGPAPTLSQDALLQAAQVLSQTVGTTGYPPEYVQGSMGAEGQRCRREGEPSVTRGQGEGVTRRLTTCKSSVMAGVCSENRDTGSRWVSRPNGWAGGGPGRKPGFSSFWVSARAC